MTTVFPPPTPPGAGRPAALRFRLPFRRGVRLALGSLLLAAVVPATPAQMPGHSVTRTGSPTSDYQIRPTDILDISVFQEPDLKSTLRVSNEGTVTFPLIGIVSVGGLTPHDVADAIQHRLAGGYLINPQVTVTVTEFSKRRFTILGEVQKPGSYDIPDEQKVSILQAIGMAGGYTRIANPNRVTLMRQSGEKASTYEFNAKKMANGTSEADFVIQPGDVITVAESDF